MLNYITSVLPELDVYGIRQMTMEELFIRLLYEEWNGKIYRVHPVSQEAWQEQKEVLPGSKNWKRTVRHTKIRRFHRRRS